MLHLPGGELDAVSQQNMLCLALLTPPETHRLDIVCCVWESPPLVVSQTLHGALQGTPGFSGADLANLVNIAAIKAARDKAIAVTQSAVEYAKDRIMMGAERKSAFITDESRTLTAYHEGGHALVAMLTSGASPVHKATIMPRGAALGMVMQLPDKDSTSVTRRQLMAMLDVCMGGRVAEELIFGGDDVTTGASQDLSSASSIARAMVTEYGFSDRVGPQKLVVRPPAS
jgi:ATP-dependent metalloprotease